MYDFPIIEDIQTPEEFFNKIKVISELFMRYIEIENADEVAIFLAETLSLCVGGYEEKLKKIK